MNEPTRYSDDGPRRYHSMFWPIVLIGIGVIWLLANFGILEWANLWLLLRLWPLLLIVAGLDILVGRRWPALGALIGLAAVGVAIVLVLFGPAWGLGMAERPSLFGLPVILGRDSDQVRTGRFREPLGNATAARVNLRLHSGSSTIEALREGKDLIDADLTYVGEIDFSVSGEREKSVSLGLQEGIRFGLSSFSWGDLPWNIRLSREVPLDLEVRGGSGKAKVNLSELQLRSLAARGGSGTMDLLLPERSGHYKADFRGGSGRLSINMPKGADVDLDVDGGSGSLSIEVAEDAQVSAQIKGGSGAISLSLPKDAEVQVKVTDSGSGGAHLPAQLQRIDGGRDKTGTWETRDFGRAKRRITLSVDLGSGSVTVR